MGDWQAALEAAAYHERLWSETNHEAPYAAAYDASTRLAPYSRRHAHELRPLDQLHARALRTPYNLAFDPADGDLYISSFTLNHVVRVRMEESRQRAKYSLLVRGDAVDSPVGLAIYKRQLLVASFTADAILRVDLETGKVIGSIGSEDELDCPEGIGIAPDGTLFVVNFLKSTLSRFDTESGAFLGSFGRARALAPSLAPMPKSHRLQGHEDLAFDLDGHVHVTAYYENLVLKFNSSSGALLKTYGFGVIHGPVGIACGPDDGNMFVSSYRESKVLRFSANGLFLGVAGGDEGDVAAATPRRVLSSPTGLAFDPHDGTLHVLSHLSGAITRFNTTTTGSSVGGGPRAWRVNGYT